VIQIGKTELYPTELPKVQDPIAVGCDAKDDDSSNVDHYTIIYLQLTVLSIF
jgi:hypothetical protein